MKYIKLIFYWVVNIFSRRKGLIPSDYSFVFTEGAQLSLFLVYSQCLGLCGEQLFRIQSLRCFHQSSCEFWLSRPISLKPLAVSFWMLSLPFKTVIASSVAWAHSAAVPSWRRPSLVHSCLFSLPYCWFFLCRGKCSRTVKWPTLQLMEWLPKTLTTRTSMLGQGKE